jgi:hypothetical protein
MIIKLQNKKNQMKALLLLPLLAMSFCDALSQTIDVDRMVTIASEDAFENLKMKYRFNDAEAVDLHRLLVERESKKMDCSMNIDNPRKRVMEKSRIDGLFRDSINAILIPKNPGISGINISMALRLSERIRLTDKKRKKLMGYALDFAKRLEANPRVNFAKEEMQVLSKNLSKNQLNTVLDEKNSIQADLKAKRAWNALDKAGETVELDSVQQMIRAKMFYSIEMRYQDLYVGQDDVLRRNLDDLYGKKPKIIRMFEALAANQQIKEKKKTKEKSVSNAFSW